MKIKLEDADVEAIASAVAAKIGTATAAADDDTTAEAEADAETTTAEDDFEGDAGGDAGGETELTADDVRNALKAVVKKFDNETAMGILKKIGGVASLSKLKPAKFQAVIDAAKKKAK